MVSKAVLPTEIVRESAMPRGYHPNPRVVMTCTPLRVSLAGGGSDLPSFYTQEAGAVLSTTIDKYLYVTVKRHGDLFSEPIRLNYSETEMVQSIDEIKNLIARECLKLLKIQPSIYISTIADLPEFSGLGSSSSFAVGLLNALHAFRGDRVSAGQLAAEAAYIEIDVLKRPIGKQDHYAAAFGGMNFFQFNPDGSVSVIPQRISTGGLGHLFDYVLMFWTGIRRDSTSVLKEQNKNTPSKMDQLRAMRNHAHHLQTIIKDGVDPLSLGKILDEGWQLKRQLASNITNSKIDSWYELAKKAGAVGGKICGAGGGGFLLFIASPEHHKRITQALKELKPLPVRQEVRGSRILMPSGE